MTAVMLLLAVLAGDGAPQSAIEVAIRGSVQPVEVHLLLRDANEQWQAVAHKMLVVPNGATRDVRFDGLGPGVYQLLAKGARPTERLATKVVLGANDTRVTALTIEPFDFTGRVTIGGVPLGRAELLLRHEELQWRAGIAFDKEGTFRVPMWQRGAFTYSVRGGALTTPYNDAVELTGDTFALDIPEARITGIVRDAKSGAAVAGALVSLQTNAGDDEHHVRLSTDAEGTFDFTGPKYGRHIVTVTAPMYVEPEPIAFELDDRTRLRELDVRLDPGRTIAVRVTDADDEPVVNATVIALAGSRLGSRIASRTTTDGDGRASVAAPADEETTLFVAARPSGLTVVRVSREAVVPGEAVNERVRIELARPSSSLLIQARTTEGAAMPPFSLLMRYNGTLLPAEIGEELAALQHLRLGTDDASDIVLRNIPAGSYEFWPYRTPDEAAAILVTGEELPAPIRVEVREGENRIGVKFAAR